MIIKLSNLDIIRFLMEKMLNYFVLKRIPFYRENERTRAILQSIKLVKKAMKFKFDIQILENGWATKDCIENINYANISMDLCKGPCDLTGRRHCSNIPFALHWSRRFEYPWAFLNAKLPINSKVPFKILDCGAGLNPLQFYLAQKGYSVYSMDIDIISLLKVDKFKNRMNLSTLHPCYGNILDIPFPDGSFDRVLCISVLEHVVEQMSSNTDIILRGCINNLLRVLKPGGLLLLTFDVNLNPKQSDRRLYYDEAENLCKSLDITIPKKAENLLFSSDTVEGRLMGRDLAVLYLILTHSGGCSSK